MKKIIITGASRGIGFELVKFFKGKNFQVLALSRNISTLILTIPTLLPQPD